MIEVITKYSVSSRRWLMTTRTAGWCWRYWLNAGTYRAGTRGKHPSCDTEKSIQERFSVYQVAGQVPETTMISVRPPPPRCGPAQGRIYCPLPSDVYQADRAGYGAGCIARADFEARQRAARTDKPPMWCRAGDRVTVRCGSPTAGDCL